MHRQPFVLLDRDGTIVVERDYLTDPDEVELIPGATEGLRRMRAHGFGLAVITNQSAIGRRMMDESHLEDVHRRMCELLGHAGIRLDGIFFCPHLPTASCRCRKPNTGLIEQAAERFGFKPGECYVVGDKPCDIEAGQRIGATTVLVRTGYGKNFADTNALRPDLVAADVLEASFRIVSSVVEERSSTSAPRLSPEG